MQDLAAWPQLFQDAVAQHRHLVGQPIHHGKIVTDEQAGELPLAL
ncbi:Uncharacterised protein [Mycobacteroides abscessus subsp. abscessus]|nr:Uncharacterised protein [Mycobacteroides abscessus subsp. abscessus]